MKPLKVPPLWPQDDGTYTVTVKTRKYGRTYAAAVMERMLRFARKQLYSRTRKPKA